MLTRLRLPLLLVTGLGAAATGLWLALPRLAGFALVHWVHLPGVSDLAVSFDSLTWRQVRIDRVSFQYRLPNSDRAVVAARNLLLDLDLPRRRVRSVRIERAELELESTPPSPGTPWPVLRLPRLPLDQLDIARLDLSWPQLGIEATPGLSVRLRQDGRKTISVAARQSSLEIAAGLAERDDRLALVLDARQDRATVLQLGAVAATALGRIPVRLRGSIDLRTLPRWQRLVPGLAVVTDAAGDASLDGRIQLGANAGEWRQAEGDLQLSSLRFGADRASVEVNGTLRFRADGETNGLPTLVDLRALPGARLTVAMADPDLGRGEAVFDTPFALRWQPVDGQLLPGHFRSDDSLRVHWRSGAWGDWVVGVRGPDISSAGPGNLQARVALDLRGRVARIEAGNLRVDQLRIDGPVTVTLSGEPDGKATVTTNGPLRLGATRLRVQDQKPWQVPTPTLAARGTLTLKNPGGDWRLGMVDGQLDGALLRAAQGSTRVTAEGWQAQVRLRDGGWRGSWRARDATLQAAGQVLELRAPRVTIRRLTSTGDADFGVEAAELRHDALAGWPVPALLAQVRKVGDTLRFTGALRRERVELLNFSGSHRLARGSGQAELSWQHDLAAMDRLLQPRPKPLASLAEVFGRDRGEAEVRWTTNGSQNALTTSASLEVTDGALQWEEARAEQATLTASLASLDPVRGQVDLRIGEARLAAGVTARDSRLRFQLNAGEVQLEALHTDLLGGTVRAEPARLYLQRSNQALPVEVRGVDLAAILALVDADGLSGTGRLDGVLPLVQAPEGLGIQDGELVSSGPGTLKYAPPGILPDNPGLQALQDFRYQQMRVKLLYRPDGSYNIGLTLDGNNPSLYGGYPIALKMSLNGQLPGLFRAAVLSGDFNDYVLEQLRSGQLR